MCKLERIKEENRIDETTLWENFYIDKPYILGGIFDILSKAIAIYNTVTLKKLYRMADFTKWGYCIAEAYNNQGEKFLESFEANKNLQSNELLEGNTVIQALLDYMDNKLFTDNNEIKITSGELYKELSENPITRKGSWVSSPKALTNTLKEYKEILEEQGLFIDFESRTTNNRYIHIVYKK